MMKYVRRKYPEIIYIDFETYSDIKVSDHGAWAYAEHPSTEVLFMSYAYDDGPVETWFPGEPFPPLILDALECSIDTVIVAHNIGFEDAIWQKTLKLPPIPCDRMVDTMTMALSLAYPAALDKLGAFLGLEEDQRKLKDGKDLIKRFCNPIRGKRHYGEDSPEHWERFIEYGRQDIVTTRHIYKTLPAFNATDMFWTEVAFDIEMNRRGVTVDIELATQLLDGIERRVKAVNKRLADLTDNRVTTVNQRDRILKELHRLELSDLQKRTVAEALERPDLSIFEHEVLSLRQEAGLAATKKFKAFLDRTSSDERLRGFCRLYGAKRTGRYNSQGVQLQNLVRPTMKWDEIQIWLDTLMFMGVEGVPEEKIMEVASNLLRPTLMAKDGYILGITDLSQIEARVLPWLAGDETTVDVFRSGRDIYKDAAARMYDLSYESIDDQQRFIGKTATLALGYGQWVTGFINFCAAMGIEMSEELAYDIVTSWRDTHQEIVSYWRLMENAFKYVLTTNGKATVRDKILFHRAGKDVVMRLPSGRRLCYPRAFLKNDKIHFHGDYGLEDTYGGKLAENATQAVARDVMVTNLPAIQRGGYDVLFTVHDEVITEFPIGYADDTKHLDSLLATPPEWASDLPLEAEGFLSYRYRKG